MGFLLVSLSAQTKGCPLNKSGKRSASLQLVVWSPVAWWLGLVFSRRAPGVQIPKPPIQATNSGLPENMGLSSWRVKEQNNQTFGGLPILRQSQLITRLGQESTGFRASPPKEEKILNTFLQGILKEFVETFGCVATSYDDKSNVAYDTPLEHDMFLQQMGRSDDCDKNVDLV